MRRKHRRTLEAIFEDPVRSDIEWRRVESLFRALGANLSEGEGSRVLVVLKGEEHVFHRPHPQKEIHKRGVRAVRRFLSTAEVTP